jgi:competence protein ComEC
MVFWDVEHGSAAYIKTPGGRHIVIDLGIGSYGDSDSTFSPLLHLKQKWGVEHLDAVIVTHPHTDHIDDISNFDALHPAVLTRPSHLTEDEIRNGNRSQDKAVVDKYLEIASKYSSPLLLDPYDPANNGGATIQRFLPTQCARTNLNNHSIVTVVSHAESKVLIPGDNEPPSWDELLKNDGFLSAIKGTDILLAPHHGRKSGFSSELFEHITPHLVIISDGRFCDTSATSNYSQNARGWKVHHRKGGEDEERKCVTTRKDGVILVELGVNADQKPFMSVTID